MKGLLSPSLSKVRAYCVMSCANCMRLGPQTFGWELFPLSKASTRSCTDKNVVVIITVLCLSTLDSSDIIRCLLEGSSLTNHLILLRASSVLTSSSLGFSSCKYGRFHERTLFHICSTFHQHFVKCERGCSRSDNLRNTLLGGKFDSD